MSRDEDFIEIEIGRPPDTNSESPAKSSRKKPAPIIGSANALKDEVFQPIKYAVKGYLVEGATILAGRPKIGKSWLALDWSIAVARGGFCFGDIRRRHGPVDANRRTGPHHP